MRIGLLDFPAGRIYVLLGKRFVEERLFPLLQSIKEFDDDSLYRLRTGKKISLKKLKEVLRQKNALLDEVSSNIILITSAKNTNVGVKNPRFPINLNSEEGARFVAAMMGDGELNSQMQVRYNNQDQELVLQILDCATRLMGNIDYKIYYRKDNTYQLHFPRIVGLITVRLGIKPMNKTINDNSIPKYLFSATVRSQAAFLAQFFTDEGNVRIIDRRLQVKQTIVCQVPKEVARKNPEKYAAKLLIGIQSLLKAFGIDCKISLGAYRRVGKLKKADWELSIYGKENLERFQKEIGFFLEYKNQLLRNCLASYKFPSAPRNKRLVFALQKFMMVEKREGYVTKKTLATESRRSVKTATYYLIDLKKKTKIKCIQKPRNHLGHRRPQRYISM